MLLEGDSFLGVPGTVAMIQDVAVNDHGDWFVRTDQTGGIDAAILNGIGVLIQGDSLPLVDGSGLAALDEIALDDALNLYWNFTTDGDQTADLVLFRNFTLLAQEGSLVDKSDLPSGTIWKGFTGVDVDSSGEILVVGLVDSPTVTGANDDALVRITVDGAGAVAAVTKLLFEGDKIPGSSDTIKSIGSNSGGHDVGFSTGHYIAFVKSSSGASNDDVVIKDGAVIAREGSQGPIPGAVWGALLNNAVDVNDSGEFVFRGKYDFGGAQGIASILLNGLPYVNAGDTNPSIAPFSYSGFGTTSNIRIGENGNVAYYAVTDNSDTALDEGYFVNRTMVVQEGVTRVGSAVIESLISIQNDFELSPSGRYLLFRAALAGGVDGVFLMDLGLVQEMEVCGSNASTLRLSDGFPVLGATVDFEMDAAQATGVTPIFLLSQDPVTGWPPCGLMTPYGELLVDLTLSAGNPVIAQFGAPWNGTSSTFQVTVPQDTALLGRSFYAQGVFWDLGDQSSAINFQLTNGLQIDLGS